MARSAWKPPYVSLSIQKKLSAGFLIRTWSRRTSILPEFVNKAFEVHNGKRFIRVKITDEMIGHKLGEFVATRKPCPHIH
ncbi:MAG: ribosomal protein S19 family protein [Candidatus Hodgkinia cicadicola]